MCKFKFVFDSGRIEYVVAGSKAAAITKYSNESGMPKDFIKAHCHITNEGNE